MTNSNGDTGDTALLKRVAKGDISAMRALYITHSETVRRFLLSRLRDEFEAADVVHDTMLDVWHGADRFEGRTTVRSWILSIARNKAVDLIRKQSRITLREPDEKLPDEAPDAEAVITASNDALRIRACVEELSPHQRAAVHLAFYEEMNYADIAVVENVPEGTIKTRIFHAKKLLMRCLSRRSKTGIDI